MHILILPSFYPSKIRPTTGLFFTDQVKMLRDAGHQVGVLIAPRLYETLAYIRDNRKLPPTLVQLDDDPEIYRLHTMWIPRTFPLISASIYGKVAKIAFDHYRQTHGHPDILHAHNIFYAGNMAVKIANHVPIPVVLTEHSTNYLRGRIFLPGQHVIARQTLQQIDKPLAVGTRLANYLNEKYNPKIRVEAIGNVVDTDYFMPGTRDMTFTFAAVGQLTKRKRFDLLISAFAQAFRDQPVRLIIGGDGSEHRNLLNLVQSLDMHSQVDLVGHLSRPEVRSLFQKASVVISSSKVETFGVTLIEAMSCGKPVIATRSGGPEQFVTDKTGLLIPVDDENALIDAMQTLYTDYDRFNQNQIRQLCIKQFSQASIVKKLEGIYHKVLESHR